MDLRRGCAAPPLKVLFRHERVVAPMVGCSDLAFRLLCRKYGADLCYTEMLDASRLVTDPAYASSVFWSQLLPPGSDQADRPLIAQLSGRDPDTLVAAARLIEERVDAVDLNLGCPQSRAKEGGYGAYLLDREHWPRVYSCVSALSRALDVPVTAKIRLLPTLDETIMFAAGLQASGCSLLACHARQRGSTTRRRSGPADLTATRALKRALHIPVLANGNVRGRDDVHTNRLFTGCDGIMVAESLLTDPTLFQPAPANTNDAKTNPANTNPANTEPPDPAGPLAHAADEAEVFIPHSRLPAGAAAASCASPPGIAPPAADAPNETGRRSGGGPSSAQRRAVALQYLELAQRYSPPSVDYARAHLSYFLGRDGTGARLVYKHSHCDPAELRAALAAASDVSQLILIARDAFGCGGRRARPAQPGVWWCSGSGGAVKEHNTAPSAGAAGGGGGLEEHKTAPSAGRGAAGGELAGPSDAYSRDGIEGGGDGAAYPEEATLGGLGSGAAGGCKRGAGPGAAELDSGIRGMAEAKRHATTRCANDDPISSVASHQWAVDGARPAPVAEEWVAQLQIGPSAMPAQQTGAMAMAAVWHAGALQLVPVQCQGDGSPNYALLALPRRRHRLMSGASGM